MKPIIQCALILAAAAAYAAPPPATRVVFVGLTDGGSWDLWLADAGGTHFSRATVSPDLDERTPALSPDRKLAAYATSAGDIRLYNVYDRASTALRLPGSGRYAWPAWSPDGRSLFYVEVLMGKGPDEGRLWKYDIATGEAQKVADEPEVEGWPSVSREGVLLFTTWTQTMRSRVLMQPPDSTAAKLLWDGSLTLSGAAWLRDGRIAVVAGDEKGQKIIVFSSGMRVKDYSVPGASGRPTPLERSLLVTRIVNGKAGLYLVDLNDGSSKPWARSAPKALVQMRDADYR